MRSSLKTAGAIVLMMTVAALIMGAIGAEVACSGADRQRTIRITYDAAIAADEHLTTYTHVHEEAIVRASPTKEQAVADLAAFRTKVDHAENVLKGVYSLVAAAALVNDDRSVATMLQAAAILSTELHDLGVTP